MTTPCGRNSDRTKTRNQCFKSGIGVGIRLSQNRRRHTPSSLRATKKGGLEQIAKREFNIKNARLKTKATLVSEILRAQRERR